MVRQLKLRPALGLCAAGGLSLTLAVTALLAEPQSNTRERNRTGTNNESAQDEREARADVGGYLNALKSHGASEQMHQAMVRVLAEQRILREIERDPQIQQEIEQQLKDPKMQDMLKQVRDTLRDQTQLHTERERVLKDQNQMLTILAHALMRQDQQMRSEIDGTDAQNASSRTGRNRDNQNRDNQNRGSQR
jgi:hypothetical protein